MLLPMMDARSLTLLRKKQINTAIQMCKEQTYDLKSIHIFTISQFHNFTISQIHNFTNSRKKR